MKGETEEKQQRAKDAVLLLKGSKSGDGQHSEDAYEAIITEAGYECHFMPVLTHRLLNLDTLTRLHRDGDYSGLIFTSQRAVEAWEKIMQESAEATNTNWKAAEHYVVGKMTADAVLKVGKHYNLNPVKVIGAVEGGSGERLAEFIARNHENREKPLLYLTGDKTKDTIPNRLKSAAIPLENCRVYETSILPDSAHKLEQKIEELCPELHLEYSPGQTVAQIREQLTGTRGRLFVIFCSPSGVSAAMPVLSQRRWPKFHIVCIGQTTGEYIKRVYNIGNYTVADSPTPESLLQAIDRAKMASLLDNAE